MLKPAACSAYLQLPREVALSNAAVDGLAAQPDFAADGIEIQENHFRHWPPPGSRGKKADAGVAVVLFSSLVIAQTDRAFQALVLLLQFRYASSRQQHSGKSGGSA